MKLVHLSPSLLVLLVVLNGCAQEAGTAITSIGPRTPIPTPKLELIPIAIGETLATAANAIVGTWQVTDFTISSKGNISGNLKIGLNRPVDFPYYQDVLIIQVWAYYIWPQSGDMLSKPAGEFIPVKASQSTGTSATFDITGKFDIPSLMLETDGGMPLNHFQVTMVWYRLTQLYENGYYGSYQAKIGSPKNFSDQPWWGVPIFDQTVSLNGNIDTNVRGGLDYSNWFAENVSLPTSTLVAYPEPLNTPSPVPVKPYPVIP